MDGTTSVVDKLRLEGFSVNAGYVQYLLRDRILHCPAKGPGGVLVWHESDVARLRSELRRRGRGPAGPEVRQ